jgi:hypothetical protein
LTRQGFQGYDTLNAGPGPKMLPAITALLLSSTAFAKDMDGRYAVGINTWLGDTPTLSARFAIPMPKEIIETQAEAVFGFSTSPASPNQLVAGGRLLYGVVVEDNMNVLAGGGMAFMMTNGTATLRLQPAVEVQYFLMGLDNLSLTAGGGANLDIGKGNSKAEIDATAMGGVHYWF